MTDTLTPDRRPSAVRARPWRWWNAVALTGLTAYSTALGWQAQAVSYPLFRAVPAENFLDYHARYNASIPWVVIVPGFVTFLSGAAFVWTRPVEVPRGPAALVSVAGVTSLLSTVLWAVPEHDRLDRLGRSSATIDSLLAANLVRSLALTAGTVTLVWCLGRVGRWVDPSGVVSSPRG